MKSIILSDNQDITRVGIEYLLQAFNLPIIYAANKADIITSLKKEPESVVILDYTISDFGSVEELVIINQRFDQAHWLLFSDELSSDFLRRLLFMSESFSIVLKACDIDEINAALKQTINHKRFVCGRVTNQLFSTHSSTDIVREVLTPTEKEILRQIALGKTTKEIAAERNLSFHTIITHRKNIFRKLEVNNLQEAIKYAMRAGIIDMSDYYI